MRAHNQFEAHQNLLRTRKSVFRPSNCCHPSAVYADISVGLWNCELRKLETCIYHQVSAHGKTTRLNMPNVTGWSGRTVTAQGKFDRFAFCLLGALKRLQTPLM